MIRDPIHFFNPRSMIRTFFNTIRTSSDQFISHVLMSKNWFESIFRWILVNRSFESTFLLKNDLQNDPWSGSFYHQWSVICDPDHFITKSGSFYHQWSMIWIILSPMIHDPDYFFDDPAHSCPIYLSHSCNLHSPNPTFNKGCEKILHPASRLYHIEYPAS